MSQKDTKYSDLETTLKAVGKAVFVRFYYDFKDASIPIDELSQKIYRENPRAKSSQQRFRIFRARHIFSEEKQIEALKIIISSSHVDDTSRDLAKDILQKEQNSSLFEIETSDENTMINKINRDFAYNEIETIQYDNYPRPPKPLATTTLTQYPRDKQVAVNALTMAKHLCEVDSNHFVFRRKNATTTYTEPHHLVPLFAQKFFPDVNLDREQNVVSLCSNCHNNLHYGADIDEILKPLYEMRKDLLQKIGIDISYEQLKNYYK